jgi:hypothetical protein
MGSPTSPYGLGEVLDLSRSVTYVFEMLMAIYYIMMNLQTFKNLGSLRSIVSRHLFGRGDIFHDVSRSSLSHLYLW